MHNSKFKMIRYFCYSLKQIQVRVLHFSFPDCLTWGHLSPRSSGTAAAKSLTRSRMFPTSSSGSGTGTTEACITNPSRSTPRSPIWREEKTEEFRFWKDTKSLRSTLTNRRHIWTTEEQFLMTNVLLRQVCYYLLFIVIGCSKVRLVLSSKSCYFI